MSVRQKFNEYKKEIRDVMENENYCNLDIVQHSTFELVNSGYLGKKIESFMHINEFTGKEINEFFYEYCKDVRTVYLGDIPEEALNCPVYDLINQLKDNAVRYMLWNELVNFVASIKQENINTN